MFSAYLRTKYSLESANKLMILLGCCSVPITTTHKDLLFLRRILSNTFTAHSHSAQSTTLVDSSESSTSRIKKKEVNLSSFTVSYLIDSCGLSPEAAVSASEKVHFATHKKPDAVLSLLRSHGFTKQQVARLVMREPRVLVAKAEETLLPKLQFYQSIGFPETNLIKTVTNSPNFLRSSLKNQIIPTYTFLKSVVASDQKVFTAMQRFPYYSISTSRRKGIVTNVSLLRSLEMPESSIALLLTHYPEAIAQRPQDFSETVTTVKEMGFIPSKSVFVAALHALSGKSNRSVWDRSYKTYTKCGWSNHDILLAFKKQPECMIISEKKITRTMEFLVNQMGWHPREIATSPRVFCCSFEKTMIPRCSVIRLLSSKGLLKKKYKVSSILIPGEKSFIDLFVTKYEAQLPELMSFYQGKKMDALKSG